MNGPCCGQAAGRFRRGRHGSRAQRCPGGIASVGVGDAGKGVGLRTRRRVLFEEHVDPVVSTAAAGGKAAAVPEYPVHAVGTRHQGREGAVGDTRVGKKAGADGKAPIGRVVGGDVHSARRDGDRRSEADLLPARSRFVDKGGRSELGAGAAPQRAHVGARVAGAFIKANARDEAANRRAEFGARLNGLATVGDIGGCGGAGSPPDAYFAGGEGGKRLVYSHVGIRRAVYDQCVRCPARSGNKLERYRTAGASRGLNGRDGGRGRRAGRYGPVVARHVGARRGRKKGIFHALDGFLAVLHRAAVYGEASQGAAGGYHGQHALEVAHVVEHRHREGQLARVPAHVAKRRVVAAIEPGQHLLGRHHGYLPLLGRRNNGIRPLHAGRQKVGVHVGRKHPVVAFGAQGIVEQGVDVRGVGNARFVGELRGGLVHVDERAVQVGEAHGHARPREHAGAVLHPVRGPVVIVVVEADAVFQLNLGLARPVAPRNAVRAVGHGPGNAGKFGRHLTELVGKETSQRSRRPDGAVRVQVQTDFKALGFVSRGLRIGHGRAGENVGRTADGRPVGHGVGRVGGAFGEVGVEPAYGAAAGVVVAGHYHGRFQAFGQVPEPGQGLLAALHHDVGQQALLLVGLGNGNLVQVHPIGEKHVVGADVRAFAVALLAGPGGVALAGIHHGAGQVIGKSNGLATVGAHGALRYGRVGGGGSGVGIQRGQAGGAALERVEVRGAVKLDGFIHDADAGAAGGAHQQVLVGERAVGRG